MGIIKHIIQSIRPTQQQTAQPASEHPNFWMFQ